MKVSCKNILGQPQTTDLTRITRSEDGSPLMVENRDPKSQQVLSVTVYFDQTTPEDAAPSTETFTEQQADRIREGVAQLDAAAGKSVDAKKSKSETS